MKCVILTRDVDEWLEIVESGKFPGIEATVSDDHSKVLAEVSEAEILMGVPPLIAPALESAPKVKWIQSSFAGVDAILAADVERTFTLTNVKGVYGKPIAEYVFAYVLSRKRRLVEHAQWHAENRWNQSASDVVEGETMAIFGTGSIGSEIARVAKAFGLATVGVNTSGKLGEHFDSCIAINNLGQLAESQPDYIVGVLPSTPATVDVFDAAFFNSLTKPATFINAGRGSNVDEEALIAALDAGKLYHAVLDVFKNEPLPKASPLWNHQHITITPHNSGYVSLKTIAHVCAANYRRYRTGEVLENIVDFEKGY